MNAIQELAPPKAIVLRRRRNTRASWKFPRQFSRSLLPLNCCNHKLKHFLETDSMSSLGDENFIHYNLTVWHISGRRRLGSWLESSRRNYTVRSPSCISIIITNHLNVQVSSRNDWSVFFVEGGDFSGKMLVTWRISAGHLLRLANSFGCSYRTRSAFLLAVDVQLGRGQRWRGKLVSPEHFPHSLAITQQVGGNILNLVPLNYMSMV